MTFLDVILRPLIKGVEMFPISYTEHYINDNHPVRDYFKLEYKNDWQLQYGKFLEQKSKKKWNHQIRAVKQFFSKILSVFPTEKSQIKFVYPS